MEGRFLTVSLNGYLFDFVKICTIFQACVEKKWYIPRFCYHVKLKLAGNCRLCFVEDINVLKPIISCATLIYNKAFILTSNSFVFKARENIMEFLLINHPLDCPVCDQGGECDLQDQYIVMGSIISRFYEISKKNAEEINISFVLKLSLNKCINCSRCTRYAHDICGEYSFSLLGRGENLKISNYNDSYFLSEIAGNVIDLCPVGAITLKNIAYSSRFWEVIEIKFIDIFDALQPPIRIDFRGINIIRVLPLTNSFLEEEWISDKVRFNFDFFNNFKQHNCFLKKNFKAINVSWLNIFFLLKSYYFKLITFFINKKFFFLNKFGFCKHSSDIYQLFLYKNFFSKLNFFNLYFFKNNSKNLFRYMYFNEKHDLDFLKTTFFIILNLNTRLESPIMNFKIREKIKFDYNTVLYFGFFASLNFFFIHCGNSLKNFFNLLKKNIFFLNDEKITLFKGKFLDNSFEFYNLLNFLFLKINIFFFKLVSLNSLEIIFNEFNLLIKNYNYKINNFFNFFNVLYDVNDYNKNNNFHSYNFKSLNILMSNFVNLTHHNVNLPLLHNFQKPAIFLNCFGVVSDFTYSSYRFFLSNFKTEWNIVKIFSEIFFLNFTLKLSTIKFKIIPRNWIKQNYYFKIYNFDIFVVKFYLLKNFYFFSNYLNFYNDFATKQSFFFKIQVNFFKRINTFQKFLKINTIQWLF